MLGSPSALLIENVHKTYSAGLGACRATVRALRGVSLDVATGETIVVLGGRGSGKSTLLMCAAGLLIPDRGRVLVHGREVRESDASRNARYVGSRGTRSTAAAIAAADDSEANLLLLDGVVDAMDACARRSLLSHIAARGVDGFAAVIATGDTSLARRLDARVVEMRGGAIAVRVDASLQHAARVAEARDDILLRRA